MAELYNGWKNRQTWNVALWLGNDRGLYLATIAIVKRLGDALSDTAIREFCEEQFPKGVTPDGDSLIGVDWYSIRDAAKDMVATDA